jgi:hypothetical protein
MTGFTPDFQQLFSNTSQITKFQSRFSDRKIVDPRWVNMPWFHSQGFSFISWLESANLVPFLSIQEKVYPNLVHVFYSNLAYNSETCTLTSEVKKTKIHIPPSLWTSLTGLQFDGAQITGSTAMG